MRGEVHILLYCPIDTLQWGQTHSAVCKKDKTTNFHDLQLKKNLGYGLDIGRRGANQKGVWRKWSLEKESNNALKYLSTTMF